MCFNCLRRLSSRLGLSSKLVGTRCSDNYQLSIINFSTQRYGVTELIFYIKDYSVSTSMFLILIPAAEPESHPCYPQEIPGQARDERIKPGMRGSRPQWGPFILHSSLFTFFGDLRTPRGLTPPPMLCRPYGLIITLHSPLYTLHSKLFILHSSLFTLHFLLFTLHYELSYFLVNSGCCRSYSS